jgi:hypothetical protein
MNEPPNVKRALAFVVDLMAAVTAKTCAKAEGGSKKAYYRPLPKEFRRDGFHFSQIGRERDVAIYAQVWDGCPDPAACFEVVRVKRRQGFQIGGRFVPPAEVYPASKLWGTDGFTLTNRDAAFAKLRELA